MTNQEALNYIKNIVFMARRNGKTTINDFLEVAREAIEKQIPKKPRYYMDNWGHNRTGCPGCPRNEILYIGQKYCKVCGTKIDWVKEV